MSSTHQAPAEDPERIVASIMEPDVWVERTTVEAAWAKMAGVVRTTTADPHGLTSPQTGAPGAYTPPVYTSHLDKSGALVIQASLDALIRYGLIMARGDEILLLSASARQAVKDSRGTPENRDRTVRIAVEHIDGSVTQEPWNTPETNALIRSIDAERRERNRQALLAATGPIV